MQLQTRKVWPPGITPLLFWVHLVASSKHAGSRKAAHAPQNALTSLLRRCGWGGGQTDKEEEVLAMAEVGGTLCLLMENWG